MNLLQKFHLMYLIISAILSILEKNLFQQLVLKYFFSSIISKEHVENKIKTLKTELTTKLKIIKFLFSIDTVKVLYTISILYF